MSARDRILGRVRGTLLKRSATEHPGSFGGWRPTPDDGTAVERFAALFEAAGGEVVAHTDDASAARWLRALASEFSSLTVGEYVAAELTPPLPVVDPASAELGVSRARGAVAETGSVIMDARDGRRSQLLAPTHVVLVDADAVFPSLRDALVSLGADLPSAIGLHSGPSKSADIGQVMVKGVHGPGRIIAVVIG